MGSDRPAREIARVDADLEAIVTLTQAAAAHLVPAPRALCGGSGGRFDSRPPLDVRALDDAMAADVLPMLESWEVAWRKHAGLSPYGPVSLIRGHLLLQGAAQFLQVHLDQMAADQDWPWALMAKMIHTARTALAWHDQQDPASGAWQVPCPAPVGSEAHCDWALLLEPGDQFIHCPSCLTTWTVAELASACLLLRTQQDEPIWATPAELATIGIDPATLRKWYQRGLIIRHGIFYDARTALRRTVSSL